MRDKLLKLLTGLALACVTGGTAHASNNKAMDTDIHAVELQWEHIKFYEDGSPTQFNDIDALAKSTAGLVQKYPGRVEPLSRPMRRTPPLSTLERRRASACFIIACLDGRSGSATTNKARQLLAQAVSLAPNGMDANYFYADFLISQHNYAAAYKILRHALALPPQQNRPLWDMNRRAVIRELMAKTQASN